MTAVAADLATYLGVELDAARATFLLAQATSLCESIVNPLPDGSDAVVLDVAARAYSNPGNVASQGVGSFNVSYGGAAGGLWLTRQNKATLRRLNGGSSAFSIDPIDPAHVAAAVDGLPFWSWDGVAYEAANPTTTTP